MKGLALRGLREKTAGDGQRLPVLGVKTNSVSLARSTSNNPSHQPQSPLERERSPMRPGMTWSSTGSSRVLPQCGQFGTWPSVYEI